MSNPIRSLIGQTAVYGVSSIAGRFLNYLLVPLYTNLFLPDEYGVVTELYAYVSILLVLLTYGMETGYFRFCQNTDYKRSTVFSTSLTALFVSSVLFSLVLCLYSNSFSGFIGYSNNESYVILLGLTVALDALSAVPFAKLRIENKARIFAIIKFINIGLNVSLNIFFLLIVPRLGSGNFIFGWFYHGLDVGYIFLSNFLASLITLIILLPQILSGLKPYVLDLKLLKKILLYSYPLLFAGIAGMMSENFDRIMLKNFLVVPEFTINLLHKVVLLPPELINPHSYIMFQIGIYGANAKIAVLMTLFIQAYRYAAEPFFFNYSKTNNSKDIYARVMKYFIVFCLMILLSISLFIDYSKYIINSKYHSGLAVVPILLLSKLIFGIVFNLSIWYKLTNKTHYGAYLAFTGAFVSIGLNWLLIPVIGYMGSAWASLAAYTTMMIISFYYMRKYYLIIYDLKRIGLYAVSAFFIYFLNIYFRIVTEYYLILNFLLIVLFVLLFIKVEKIKLRASLAQILKR